MPIVRTLCTQLAAAHDGASNIKRHRRRMVSAKCLMTAYLFAYMDFLTSYPAMNKPGAYSSSGRRTPSNIGIPVFVRSPCGLVLPRKHINSRAISREEYGNSAAVLQWWSQVWPSGDDYASLCVL